MIDGADAEVGGDDGEVGDKQVCLIIIKPWER